MNLKIVLSVIYCLSGVMVVASQEEKAPTASTLKQARVIIARLDRELRATDRIAKKQNAKVQDLQEQVIVLQTQLAIANREKQSAIAGREKAKTLAATYLKRVHEVEENARVQKQRADTATTDLAVFHFDSTDLQGRASKDAKTIAHQAAQIADLAGKNRLRRLSKFAYVD